MAERGVLKLKIGGVDRTLRVEIEHSVQIEESLGIGIVPLTRQFIEGVGRASHATEILRIVLAGNGVKFSQVEMLRHLQTDGILPTITNAGRVLDAFFSVPETRQGNARGGQKVTASH